jgi:hypothetical protein
MRFMKPFIFALALVLPVAVFGKNATSTCHVKFAVVYIDHLNNTYHGLDAKARKDVEKKLSKNGDVCYVSEDDADYVFFVHTQPAVYHGVKTTQTTNTQSNPVNGTITDASGNNAGSVSGTVDTTTTTTSSAPYQVDYSVFLLNILRPHTEDGKTTYATVHTLEQKGLYNTMYGMGYGKGKHPLQNVVIDAAKWLHENNYGR